MIGFLLDTNCFIQIVRNRPDPPNVQSLLQAVPLSRVFMSDYTMHSIGVVMSRFGQVNGYVSFLNGLGVGRGFGVAEIEVARLEHVATV